LNVDYLDSYVEKMVEMNPDKRVLLTNCVRDTKIECSQKDFVLTLLAWAINLYSWSKIHSLTQENLQTMKVCDDAFYYLINKLRSTTEGNNVHYEILD